MSKSNSLINIGDIGDYFHDVSPADNAIAEIYKRHVKTVYRVCFAYLKNVTDTEDATADTFVKLIKYARSFQSEEHEKAWLIRTAINVCKDNLKHWWRTNESISDYSENLESKNKIPFEADALTQEILNLPNKYKSVIYMYYFEGYTSVEISRILKKPQSTIRSHLRTAREILRERLGYFYE